MKAKARLDVKPRMNKLEAAFAHHLHLLERADAIFAWRFEPITLKLAHDTRYTPDFLTIGLDGELIFYETKGYWREDARLKIRVAATRFPWFKFVGVTRDKDGWQYEEFKP